MRFGNSRDYLGLQSNLWDAHGDKPLPARLLTLPVTDATVTAFAGLLNVVHEIMSAIAICSIVTRQPACQSQLRL
jgi:hypothetical protein